jgi:hypothetical protein
MGEMSEVEKLVALLEKQAAILRERAKEHGSFDVFERASWLADMGVDEVLNAMIGVKKARLERNPFNEDSLLDLLNYQAIATMYMVKKMQEEKGKE